MPYDPLEETDALDAASLNDRFTAIETLINNLPAGSLQPHGLGDRNLNGKLVADDVFNMSYTVVQPSAYVDYNNVYPGWDSDTYAANADNATDPGDTGWYVIQDGVGGSLESTFASALTLGMGNSDRVGAILVQVSLEKAIVVAEDAIGVAPQWPGCKSLAVRVALQYKNSLDAWVTIPHTDRGLSGGFIRRLAPEDGSENLGWWTVNAHASIDLTTVILESDVTSGIIKGIRAVCALQGQTGGLSAGASYKIFRAEMSYIPLHCSIGTMS